MRDFKKVKNCFSKIKIKIVKFLGTQEVIQDIPQNHVMMIDNNEEEELRGQGSLIRLGRR